MLSYYFSQKTTRQLRVEFEVSRLIMKLILNFSNKCGQMSIEDQLQLDVIYTVRKNVP